MKFEKPIKLVLLVFSFFMTLAVNITDGCVLSNEALYDFLPKKNGNAVIILSFISQ